VLRFDIAPRFQVEGVTGPFAPRCQILQHQMSELGICVIALNIDVETVDAQDDVVLLQNWFCAVWFIRHINDQHPARLALELQEGARSRILRWLPIEIEITQSAINTFLAGLGNRLEERRRGGGGGSSFL